MDNKLLKKIPEKYHAAIADIYQDGDGYWCMIGCKSGWILEGYYANFVIHEDAFKEVLAVIRQSLKKI